MSIYQPTIPASDVHELLHAMRGVSRLICFAAMAAGTSTIDPEDLEALQQALDDRIGAFRRKHAAALPAEGGTHG